MAQRMAESIHLQEQRAANLPQVHFDQSLPIFHRREEIAEAIKNHPVVVVSGETGSGKSTQLPLIAIQAGFGVRGFIGHTQPRRIAARSVASRIAQQLKTQVGRSVGFKIRFDDVTSDETYVKLMTDGILLAEIQNDRFLDQYEMVIIDEAHERSLNIDFLLGHLKNISRKRKDLKIIITSATIDTQKFAKHFQQGDAEVPVIDVEGRTWPVEMRYCDPVESADGYDGMAEYVVRSTIDVVASEKGDVLVFLPTENDIRTVSRKLKGTLQDSLDVLPLYARLSTAQQNAIFQPGSRRRIVLATNVAESSITVPGIRIVVDSGTARISHYAPRSKVQRLPIRSISQASADQRAGRCGRIGPGICVRLYSEEDYLSRPRFTTPEIRRSNLASVILRILALKLGDIRDYPFIDPPGPDAIADGYRTLYEIGAIDDARRLTQLGQWLSRLPIDPRVGRMIHAASEEGCLHEVLIIAAALEIQDPRVRPAEKQKLADEQHQRFADEKSDFVSYLKLWDFFHDLKDKLSRSRFRLACQENFLSVNLLRQWQEIHRQLARIARQNKLVIHQRRDDFDAIHRSLLTGLLSGIGHRNDRQHYQGTSGIPFQLWPGSGVFKKRPQWIVAAEIVETSKRYGRTVGAIDPAWIEPLADHLVKRRYVDPHWSRKRQTVLAFENVSLFGLPIVVRRRLSYLRIDPALSRQLFIEEGLAESEIRGSFQFLERNRALLDEVAQLAAKTRRRDLILDSQWLVRFYEEHLPEDCGDTNSLRAALKSDPGLDNRLRLSIADLFPGRTEIPTPEEFPDRVQIGTMDLPVEYRFEPGTESDGASIRIPQEGLGQLGEIEAGWLIPGLIQSRIESLIRSLPKSVRRNLVPVPTTAARLMKSIEPGSESLVQAVAKELTRISGQPVDVKMFDLEKVDEHLMVNLQIIDDKGELIAHGRHVNQLRRELLDGHSNFLENDDSEWHQDGLMNWSWSDLPAEVPVRRNQTSMSLFPAIVDQDQAVGLRLVGCSKLAGHLSETGLLRLFALQLQSKLKRQINWLPDLDRHAVNLAWLVVSADLKAGLSDLITRVALIDKVDPPGNADQFNQQLADATQPIAMATQDIANWLPRFAESAHRAQLVLEDLPANAQQAKADILQQIGSLTAERFLTQKRWHWLQHYPRYFNAIAARCEKISQGATTKDAENGEVVSTYVLRWQDFEEGQAAAGTYDPEIEKLGWMIEELRVSLFAQQLGTSLSVSPQRLDKQIQKIESGRL